MEVIVLFIFAMVIGAAWWLWKHDITEKPWLTEGLVEDHKGQGTLYPAAKVGLVVFLAVVTSLFALFISAYYMRMELSDWHPMPTPGILWFNTGLLILGSIAMQWSWYSIRREDHTGVQVGLLVGGGLTIAFIMGQLWAWVQLRDMGYLLASNPANAFFYLLTGLHALHLAGGLWVWLKTIVNLLSGAEMAKVRLSVELCTTYWHFLLIVWLVLFGLLLNT